MANITTGVGLISGLPINDLVEQLMAIESRPRNLLAEQVNALDVVKAAWMDLSARLLGIKSAVAPFDAADAFNAVTATSSNASALTISAQAGAAQGSYTFTPARLATTHQVIASGFPDSDTTPVPAGTITIELGKGHLNRATALEFLNGQAGVARGSIRITDRSGASATLDLTAATTVQDVLDAINQSPEVAVTASVRGDAIVLTDTSGSTSQSLTVTEVNGGTTAAGLGLVGSAVGNVLTGAGVVSVTASTRLAHLNDGNGVRVKAGDDILFTLEDATELRVDLSSGGTVGDVIDAINNATGNGGKLVASLADGLRIRLTDTTAGPGTLSVSALHSSQAAADLGLLAADGDADHVITGSRLVAGLNTVLLRNLNGGAGVTAGAISIQDRGTGSAVVDLSSAQTVQDVLDAINGAAGVSVSASLNAAGSGIRVTDTSSQSLRNFVIAESGSTTAADLNILHDAADTAADSANLQHRYFSENTELADIGFVRGQFTITDSSGKSATVDLTQGDETTVGHVIAEINSRGLGVTASINSRGDGLLLTDTAGGAGTLTVSESGSTTAASLGIAGSDADGDGVIDGSFEITVTISDGDTLQDVANAISASSSRVSASIVNDGSSLAPSRLVVTSGVSGTAGRLIIAAGGTGLSFTSMVQPQDALLFLGDPSNPNSVAIQSSGNSLANVISGTTINLVNTSAAPVSVSISRSADTLVNQVKNFVALFNSTVEQIDKLTKYDAATGSRGVLQGNATAVMIRTRLFNMVTRNYSSAGSTYSRLNQVGIRIAGGGASIEFNEEKFRQVYASDQAQVSQLFTKAADGVGDQMKAVMSGITDPADGTVRRHTDSLDNRRELYTSRIADLDRLLALRRTRMLRQFQQMESALAQLQSQQSSLSGLTTALLSSLSAGTTGQS